MNPHPLNIFRLSRDQSVVLNGERAAYRFCTTTLAAFLMATTGRLREFELTTQGDVKDWNGNVFNGGNGSYGTRRADPYRQHSRPAQHPPDEGSFYLGNA